MKRIVAVVDDIYEDLELWYPRIRLEEEGWKVVVAGPEAGKVYAGKHGYPCKTDISFAEMRPADYDALLVPGGFAPDKMRRDGRVLDLVRSMNDQGKLIAFICHAGWVLISAGILRGKRATSTVGIRDDMVNAGTRWVDEALVIDGNLVSSRTPADLAPFARAMVDWLQGRLAKSQAA
ncbi:MAG TPA: type 1 glutamine amidotransferase domain-containing protein [Spirochaetia bacterium]|nr:type 1 glutamine amidotransferase domain-containing protein [Spirochaetia bacterium]